MGPPRWIVGKFESLEFSIFQNFRAPSVPFVVCSQRAAAIDHTYDTLTNRRTAKQASAVVRECRPVEELLN